MPKLTDNILRTFGALRHRDYRLFWAATCVSFVGTWIQNVALGLYVYSLTGSKQALGVVGLAAGLPVSVLLLYGGAVADRFDKRRILFTTQSLYALSAFALGLLVLGGKATVLHVVAISLFNGLLFSLDGPARQSLVYDLVGAEDLATGVALQSASFNVARVLGPAIGGVLYAVVGPAACFFVNAVSFGAVLLALTRIKINRTSSPRVDNRSGIRPSFEYLKNALPARVILSLTAVSSIFGVANYQTLMPALARDHYGITQDDARYGFLFSAIGLGSLCGAYLVGRNASSGRRGRTVRNGAFMLAATFLALSQTSLYPAALVVFFFVGMSAISQLATSNSLVQTMAPEGLRARAVSLHMLAMAGLQPVGAILAGTIAERFGAQTSLGVGGAVILCWAMYLAFRHPAVFRTA